MAELTSQDDHTLRDGLRSIWQRTTVVAITDFRRTVRVNGPGGTDIGAAGAMIFAGSI